MSHSSALYRPSILELARAGNLRAIAYWMNSLLGPHGLIIRIQPTRSGRLHFLVDFTQSRSREHPLRLQKQLVRFICYRLWTLNSESIRDVRIVARIAGNSTPLWQQSVRIITPANRRTRRQSRAHLLTQQTASWFWFQVLRSLVISRLAVAGFFLCYWMLHWELTHNRAINQPTAAVSPAAIAPADLAQSSNKAQLRAAIQDSSQALLTVPESFQGQVVREAQSIGSEKLVALTFDDGPWTETTEQVLDILRQNNIKATFYWVGLQVQKNPDIARKVVAQGHAIGNHTWRHVLENVDELTAAEEINNTAKLIYDTTGLRTSLFRPPGGNLKGSLASFAQQQKYAVTLWSVESDDYYVSAPIIVDNVLSAVQPGSIVLMHDGGGDRRATVQALPQVISTLQRRGYKFVTVPQLLAAQAQSSITAQIKP